MRIRIRLDEINFVGGREPEVDACVTVDGEQTIDAFACFLEVADERWIELFGKLIPQTFALAILVVPFRAVGRDFRLVRGGIAEDHFANRKHGQAHIAHQTHVKFTAIDVLLGNRVGAAFFVNKGDAFPKLLVGLDEGRLRNSVGRFFFHGLNQNRELELSGSADALATRDHDKVGNMDAVIVEDFF